MPSKTPSQARLMAACSHGADYPSCPPASVANEFNQADKGGPMLKGHVPHDASYAQGGPVLGRKRDFLKEGDMFAGTKLRPEQAKFEVPQDYDGSKENVRTFKASSGKTATIKTKHPGPNVIKGFGSKDNRGY
jgi:hypothetical protein